MKLYQAALGSKVLVPKYDLADIVAFRWRNKTIPNYSKLETLIEAPIACLGWFTEPSNMSWQNFGPYFNEVYKQYTERVDNLSEYKYGLWINAEIECSLGILNLDQKCMNCRLPAPHTNPNQPDNKYLCSSCVLLKELDTL